MTFEESFEKYWAKQNDGFCYEGCTPEFLVGVEKYKRFAKELFFNGWNAALESQWQDIELLPINIPVILILNGVVQNVTYIFDGEYWHTVDSEEQVHEKFNPSHFQLLPKPPQNEQ